MVVYLLRRVLRDNTTTKAREHKKKFMLYCLYVLGFNFLLSILIIFADKIYIQPKHLQINKLYESKGESFATDNCCLR